LLIGKFEERQAMWRRGPPQWGLSSWTRWLRTTACRVRAN